MENLTKSRWACSFLTPSSRARHPDTYIDTPLGNVAFMSEHHTFLHVYTCHEDWKKLDVVVRPIFSVSIENPVLCDDDSYLDFFSCMNRVIISFSVPDNTACGVS